MRASPPQSPRERRALERLRGAVDGLDLGLGVLLLAGLPAISYLVVQGFVVEEVAVTPDNQIEQPKLGKDEMESRMRFIRSLYYENARAFLERAADQDAGRHQVSQLRWTVDAINRVATEIATLENLLSETGSNSLYPNHIAELTQIKQRFREDLERVKDLDLHGVLDLRGI